MGSRDRDLAVTGMKFFPYDHSSPGNRDKFFLDKIALLSQHSGQNGIIFVLYVFPLEKLLRISFISKISLVHKATTATNDTSLCSTI